MTLGIFLENIFEKEFPNEKRMKSKTNEGSNSDFPPKSICQVNFGGK
jgi:hypothetical protein